MRVGVFLPNWVGDVVMATPAIRALRSHVGPDGQLIGIMRPYVAQVLDGNPWFDHVVLYDKQPKRPELRWPTVRRQLRQWDLDSTVLLTNSLRTGWMAWRSGARERIGFAGNLRGGLLTTKLFEPRRRGRKIGLPPIDSYLNLAYAAGCEWEPPRLELATTASDEQAADAVWHRLGLPTGDQVVVLNSGGAFGGAKHWPVEHFAALAKRLATERGLSVLVNCGPAERAIARQIVSLAADRRVVSLVDETDLPIGLTKACIRRSRLLVTTDSGPRFFGIAFGRPVVTLFGPTDPLATQTHYESEIPLSLSNTPLSLECQPCWKRTCPLQHHRCMRDLGVATVFNACHQLLANETIGAAAA